MKCKVCGFRLGNDMKKCPMCGAEAGSTIAGEISAEMDLPKYFCPSCKGEILGEHRYCPHCGIDIKEARREAEIVQNVVDNSEMRQTSEQPMNVKTETMQGDSSQKEINQSAMKQSEILKPNPVGFWICTIFTFVFLCIALLKDFTIIGGALILVGVPCLYCNWKFIFHGKNKSERMTGYIAWGFFSIFPVLAAIL